MCYVLSGINQPISFTQLYDAMSEYGLINYFDLMQTLNHLIALGHIECPDTEKYAVTESGREIAAVFERNLPIAVREKALAATRRLLDREVRLREVRIIQTPANGGFMMEFALPDGADDLLCIRAFSPTREHCDQMRKRFLNAPITIYRGVMALLAGDENLLGDAPDEEELF